MSSIAINLYNKFSQKAKLLQNTDEFLVWNKKAKGDLGAATTLGIAILVESGQDVLLASKKMLDPEVGLLLEVSPDRVMHALLSSMDYDTLMHFNQDALRTLDFIPHDPMGHFALWSFPDGSSWVSIKSHEKELAYNALMAFDEFSKENMNHSFKPSEDFIKDLWTLWNRDQGTLGVSIGQKFLAAKIASEPFVALSAFESKTLVAGLTKAWARESISWGKGFQFKFHSNGSLVQPAEFEKIATKALLKGREELLKLSAKRMEDIKKERDARLKIHWRDALCIFIAQSQAMPIYDAGFASFLMTKPGLFGQFPLPVWRKMFFDIIDLIKVLPEGESPDLPFIESAASILGSETSSQLAHFLYRYHRVGGAKLTAKRVLEQTKDRILFDSAKQGLAAAVKSKDPISEEMREASKFASSVEFSAQYGAALALYASLWARETGFANISIQAKALVKTLRGSGDISMECFGWFARLMFEFSEGFVGKEEIFLALKTEMELAAKIADDEKRIGGRITIENEWSGNWGSELGLRKVREYLGMDQSK